MASADIVTMNGDIGFNPHHRDDITSALSLKRHEIDEEIREFQAQKEKEYKDFEEQLQRRNRPGRHEGESAGAESSPQTERSGGEKSRPRNHRRLSSDDRRLNRPPRSARQALNQAFSMSSEEARDFEGVFTPEYLGLIDAKENQHKKPVDSSHARSDPEAQLSSSDTLHPPLIYPWSSSPVQSYKVSTSAPEHGSPAKAHHRSDSANSTLSVQSLRSSMKDPRTPKSPKRVLFSIEDGVVSPSTSPSLNRKERAPSAGEENAPESLLSFAKRTSREKKKNRRKERGDGDRGRRGRGELEGLGITENSATSPLKSETWTSSIPIIQTKDNQPHSTTVKDGSDNLDELDSAVADESGMFAFDEDLSTQPSSKPPAFKDELELEEDGDLVSSKALDAMGTSPHAGSLPIEIKWPERRESGGSG